MHTNDAVSRLAKELLDSGRSCLSEREQRGILHIAKRLNASQDVNVILAKEETPGERLADRVAQLGGSWGFIMVFTGLMAAWVIANTVVLTRFGGGFDPYPYILLNLRAPQSGGAAARPAIGTLDIRAVETIWCGEFDRLKALVTQGCDELAVEHAHTIKQYPLNVNASSAAFSFKKPSIRFPIGLPFSSRCERLVPR